MLAFGGFEWVSEHLLDVEILANGISGGHHVVDIHVFNKAFHGANSFGDLLLGHSSSDTFGTSGDTAEKGVGEFCLLI